MKITLRRKLVLKSAIVYMRLKRKIRRDEIKEYLNGNIEFSTTDPEISEIITRRVKKYLQDIGLYSEINNRYELTPDGQKAKDNGRVIEKEEGKYQIWYTQKDPLFGDRIFHFRRIKPELSDITLKDLELDFSGKTFYSLPIRGMDECDFEFLVYDTAKKYQEAVKENETIDCVWTWNEIKNSSFTFTGRFETNDTDKDDKPKIDIIDNTMSRDLQIKLERHIDTIIPNWNNETKRCKIKLENIENDETYLSFEYTGRRYREGYDSCFYESLPVEPYDSDEANKWRNKIISIELAKGFMHPDDFTGNIISINQKEGFSAYSAQLDDDIPDIHQHISKLDPAKKSSRGADFWHLAAPMDLNIGIPQQSKVDSFSLLKDESICFRDLAQKFGRITAGIKVFYYDKYVANSHQQRKVAAFLNSFGVSDICIITDTTQQDFDKYLAQNKPAIAVEDIGSVYQQNRRDALHDRFIIFKHGGDITVWTSTNSIDYIKFNVKGEIQPNDPGKIFQSVTFTRVKKNILGSQLENFILGR